MISAYKAVKRSVQVYGIKIIVLRSEGALIDCAFCHWVCLLQKLDGSFFLSSEIFDAFKTFLFICLLLVIELS